MSMTHIQRLIENQEQSPDNKCCNSQAKRVARRSLRRMLNHRCKKENENQDADTAGFMKEL